jgi:cytochrome c biogenesis protein CcmG/thiol:disulfide interchange protein DsbE
MLPGLIALAAVGVLALLAFGVSEQNDTSSIDAQVARGRFPMAPSQTQALPVLGSSAKRTLADYRGRVVVLNVFASWCDPCAAEAPVLAREQTVLARKGATMLGIAYEDASPSSEAFARRYHFTFPILRDVSGSFAQSFGTKAVPETFVINRQGRVQALRRYPVTSQWLEQNVPRILKQSA